MLKDNLEMTFLEEISNGLDNSIKDMSLQCNKINEFLLNLRFVKHHSISFQECQFSLVKRFKKIAFSSIEDLALKIVTSIEVKTKLGDVSPDQIYGKDNVNFKDNCSASLISKAFDLLNFI